jgi:hypothetical protein
MSLEFTSHETVAVRAAKAWDSPHAGTVPNLLSSTLELAPFYTVPFIDYLGRKEGTQIIYVTHHPEDDLPSITNETQLVSAEGGRL